MKQNQYFFSHDANAHDDPKCMLLVDQLGAEGYGIFWFLVEILRAQDSYSCSMDMIPSLARRINSTPEKVKTVILSYGLFKVTEEFFFYSESLLNRMEVYKEKCLKAKKAVEARWSKKKQLPNNERNTDVLPSNNGRNTIKENKRKEYNKKDTKVSKEISASKDALPEAKLPAQKNINYQALISLFNEKFNGVLPRVTRLTEKRKKSIRARISEYSKKEVITVFDKVQKSSFLRGRNDCDWQADFDWIFKPTNFTKILEGNYDNKSNKQDEQKERDKEFAAYYDNKLNEGCSN